MDSVKNQTAPKVETPKAETPKPTAKPTVKSKRLSLEQLRQIEYFESKLGKNARQGTARDWIKPLADQFKVSVSSITSAARDIAKRIANYGKGQANKVVPMDGKEFQNRLADARKHATGTSG